MRATGDLDSTYLQRTLRLLRDYRGREEPVHLINCLIGLLLLPRESTFRRLPEEPLAALQGWGIRPRSISGNGHAGNGNGHGPTLRHVVRELRAALCRLDVKPLQASGRITGLEFGDRHGFHAVLRTAELKRFVEKLAGHVVVHGRFGPYSSLVNARYVASWQREPFHRPSCRCARSISRRNLHGVRSRHAALRAGHRPCRMCRP